MNFDELLKLVRSGNSPRLCDDSRLVGDGDIFVAVKGPNADGHDFISQVIAKGAKYIVCQSTSAVIPAQAGIQFVVVPDSSLVLASLAEAENGDRASKL